AQTVKGDSKDLNFTVKYTKNATDSDKQDGTNTPSNPDSNSKNPALSERTKPQTNRNPLPSKQQHTSRLDKYNKLPDTAKKEQRYSIAGLLGVSAVLSLFGLSGRRNKKN
ncbi:hypothetical protein, partial [Fructobacillus tropaeoli]